MADLGKWFKLYVNWDEDPHIDALSLEDQARWCKFGTYMKHHGTEGTIKLVPPARTLQAKFRVNTFEEVVSCLLRMPSYLVERRCNSSVSSETVVTVSCKNWSPYQGDFSTERVRKFRAHETAKRRGEEKRGEEKRGEDNNNGVPYQDLLKTWNDNCRSLPKVSHLTASRKTKMAARWAEVAELAYWQRAVERLASSTFARENSWASIDWLIANDTNHRKVMEGKYDDKKRIGVASDVQTIN